MVKVFRTSEFTAWLASLSLREQGQIEKRLNQITFEGHFGIFKRLFGDLFELKWGNGRRVYFTFLELAPDKIVLILIGGNKNTQAKDITEAQLIIGKIKRIK